VRSTSFSLNPSLNKRIKSKRIEDPRKQVVLKVKRSLGAMNQTAAHVTHETNSRVSNTSLGPL
jgi:hypothetical protein